MISVWVGWPETAYLCGVIVAIFIKLVCVGISRFRIIYTAFEDGGFLFYADFKNRNVRLGQQGHGVSLNVATTAKVRQISLNSFYKCPNYPKPCTDLGSYIR